MEVVTLKSTLLYYLNHFLTIEYKEEDGNFIDFLHDRKAQSSSEIANHQTQASNWRQIPLKKQQTDTEVLYTTALPHLLKQGLRAQNDLTHRDLSFQEITLRFTNQLQIFQLKPWVNDPLFTEKTLSVLSNLWKAFKIESERPGQISFRLSSQGVCLWINQLQNTRQMAETNHTLFIRKGPFKSVQNPTYRTAVNRPNPQLLKRGHECTKLQREQIVWQAQYTYARCCSLMRHWYALRTGESTCQSSIAQSSIAQSFIVLESQSCQTRQLIQVLVETADDIAWVPVRHPDNQYLLLLKRAEKLYRAFDQFHKVSAFVPSTSMSHTANEANTFNDADGKQPPIPQLPLYLTLVSSTRSLLKVLLNDSLREAAPEQL